MLIYMDLELVDGLIGIYELNGFIVDAFKVPVSQAIYVVGWVPI